MKRLIQGLTVLLFATTLSFGQTMSEAAKKNSLGAQMVSVVNVSKAFYTKGQTYNDFVKAMAIPSPTVPSQDEFLRKVYGYLNAATPDCDILKGDNSSLSRFAVDLANSPKNQGTPNTVYSDKKKWWQILINTVINVAADIFIPANDINVDLWPDE